MKKATRKSNGTKAAVTVASGVANAKVSIIMGSQSDWDTMKEAAVWLDALGVRYEVRVVSAHRTPDLLFDYAEQAESRGIEVIIAGAGGAAHLPGMCAAKTSLPVLGVPVESKMLRGVDSLLSMVQMPAGVAVGTLAIGPSGAKNAALFAAQILARQDARVRAAVMNFREEQTKRVLASPDPRRGTPMIPAALSVEYTGKLPKTATKREKSR